MHKLTEPELCETEITITISGSNYYRLPVDVRELLPVSIDKCNSTGQLSFTITVNRFQQIEPILKRLSTNH